jgi:hypothetical protein
LQCIVESAERLPATIVAGSVDDPAADTVAFTAESGGKKFIVWRGRESAPVAGTGALRVCGDAMAYEVVEPEGDGWIVILESDVQRKSTAFDYVDHTSLQFTEDDRSVTFAAQRGFVTL